MTGSAVWDTQVWHYTEHCDSFQKQTMMEGRGYSHIHNNSVRCFVNSTSLIFKVRHIWETYSTATDTFSRMLNKGLYQKMKFFLNKIAVSISEPMWAVAPGWWAEVTAKLRKDKHILRHLLFQGAYPWWSMAKYWDTNSCDTHNFWVLPHISRGSVRGRMQSITESYTWFQDLWRLCSEDESLIKCSLCKGLRNTCLSLTFMILRDHMLDSVCLPDSSLNVNAKPEEFRLSRDAIGI